MGEAVRVILLGILVFCIMTAFTNFSSPLSSSDGSPTQLALRQFSREKPAFARERSFAIAFLMAACDHTDSCLFFVTNVLIAKALLDDAGFAGNVVVLIRMSSSSQSKSIPHEDWLIRAGVYIKYLRPLKGKDNFVLAQLEKFRILDLVEYSRVLYMDCDSIPLCDFHYLFEASYSGQIEGSLIVGQGASPAAGSIFMVTPRKGEFTKIMQTVKTAVKGRAAFDVNNGWGHAFSGIGEDRWCTFYGCGTKWDFYGATADQGVLLYWIKYMQKNYTLILKDQMITYNDELNPDGNLLPDGTDIGSIVKQETALPGCASPTYDRRIHLHDEEWRQTSGIYVDQYHFAGAGKPWINPLSEKDIRQFAHNITTGKQLWWYWLSRANTSYGKNIVLPHPLPPSTMSPPLGLKPLASSLYERNVVIETY